MSHADDDGDRLRTVETPLGRIAYLELGDADAPPLVYLHGFPDHPPTARRFLAHLAAGGHRVLAPWLRGYAPSVLSGPYHIDQLADDALALVAALAPGRTATLVGHDWGAIAAHVIRGRPASAFDRIVTMSVPTPSELMRGALAEPAQLLSSWYMAYLNLPGATWLVARDDLALVDRLWRTWSPGFTLDTDERRSLHACLVASWPAPARYYRSLVRPPGAALDRLRRASRASTVPHLHLHGERDGCIRVGLARRGDGEVAVVPGAGHFLQVEAPERVGDLIRDWLARVG